MPGKKHNTPKKEVEQLLSDIDDCCVPEK